MLLIKSFISLFITVSGTDDEVGSGDALSIFEVSVGAGVKASKVHP
ncbi:MAG: hypothetical protein ACLRXH_02645 [Monoglobus pectinilyticus]